MQGWPQDFDCHGDFRGFNVALPQLREWNWLLIFQVQVSCVNSHALSNLGQKYLRDCLVPYASPQSLTSSDRELLVVAHIPEFQLAFTRSQAISMAGPVL